MVTVPELDLGVLTAAIATPYSKNGAVNLGLLYDLAQHYRDIGVEGLYCCGSSGEGLLLAKQERIDIVRTVTNAVGGTIPVVAHVGALSTREAIDLAKQSRDAGADALSMIPPIYYKLSLEAVVAHYQAVLDEVSLPLLVYNIPQFTGTEFDYHSIDLLLNDPRVIGVKQTAHNMFSLERMATAYPSKTMINGFDEVYLAATMAGAKGSIGTTIGLQLKLFTAVRTLISSGNIIAAMQVQSMINDVIEELVSIDVFPAAKYLSGLRSIGDLGPCRGPFLPLSQSGKERIRYLSQRIDDFEEKAISLLH